jgi:general secretion pathway protein M
MSEGLTKLKAKWSDLTVSEKQTVAIGGGVAALLLFYLLIWGPYLDRIDTMRKQIRAEQKNLAWMVAANDRIKKLENQTKHNTANMTPVMLLSELQKQIREAGLDGSLTGLKQSSSDAVEMHFQKVSFDQVIKMLTTVLIEQGVTVSQFSAVSQHSPGVVNVDVVLSLI